MATERMIPLLPCGRIKEMLDFYTDLGFTITYQQKAPNVYAAVQRGGIELHFYVMKGHDSTRNHCSCIVQVDDPEPLHQGFTQALKQERGKVPLTGIPRLARWRKGQTRFNLVDPAGNWIRFISRDEQWEAGSRQKTSGSAIDAPGSRLAAALQMAWRLRDGKGDDLAAARVLDAALARSDSGSMPERARVIVARAEVGAALGQRDVVMAMYAALKGLPLRDEERRALRMELDEMTRLVNDHAGRPA
jgi:catechol 2,3-dioxygenase-like lactoylglutathione lyase family enzyme